MDKRKKWIFRLSLVATMLAFVVVTLGAYTRLTHSGLGCPDWPGCYGHMAVPSSIIALAQANHLYPSDPVEAKKAWTEMIHRYVAGTLALLVFLLSFLLWRYRKSLAVAPVVPFLLFGLIIFQALLGMWTVTMRLDPMVVMGHLLGGMTLLALLAAMMFKLKDAFAAGSRINLVAYRFWVLLALIIVACQIMLGGWTSANYAGLVCHNFPYCGNSLIPHLELAQALNIPGVAAAHHSAAGVPNSVRITIQMLHRIGAVVTALYVGGLALWLILATSIRLLRQLGVVILSVLCAQIMLGIINVIYLLPLTMALLHNVVAALLLSSIVALYRAVVVNSQSEVVFASMNLQSSNPV